MPKLSVIIADKSYLVRKGLVSILMEIPLVGKIIEIDNEETLFPALEKDTYEILFLNPSIIGSGKYQILEEKIAPGQVPVLIGIIISTGIKEPQIEFTETIYLEESKSRLSKKIEEVVLQVSRNQPDQEESQELTDREKSILRHIALGYTNKEIGEKLYISAHTVVTHRKNITKKLGIKTVSGLTVYAILNKIVEMDEIRS